MELSGRWRAHEAEGDLAKEFPDTTFDDTSWAEVDVPHHWRHTPMFTDSDGPLLYRRRFVAERSESGRRRYLELDGVFYYGDVWLDGDYVGATEGYFFPHTFEITEACAERDEHVLAVEVACPPQRDRSAKRTVTGVFGQWNSSDPEWNPGGLWRDVRIVETGPVRIARYRLACIEASVERGRLLLTFRLDAGERPTEAVLHARITGPEGDELLTARRDATLAAGENELSWTLTVETPPRWWPHSLGSQPLCAVTIDIEVDGSVSDSRTSRTAFREIRSHAWQFSVNGERMFLKGANHGPTHMAQADAAADDVRRDVDLAIDANLDFLRVHAHVARPELYDTADERGLLLWQDLPLKWGYARGVRKQAARQARIMVDCLGHHPSVFVWCAHNAPVAYDREPGEPWTRGGRVKLAATTFLPTWTKQVLDTSVARAMSRRDQTRPAIRHSGALSLYYGWRNGTIAGLAPALRRWPRLARFVSEFGAQAVPDTDEWMEPSRWPALDWDRLTRHNALERDEFERIAPVDESKSLPEWKDATQAYQAALLQLQVEDLRRLKYAPAGGFAQFSFADGQPAVSWSVLDHQRVPKRGYHALRDACRPVLPMIEPRAGLVHVVNDTRAELVDAVVEVSVDGRVRRWGGDVGADGIAFVGRVDLADAVDVEITFDHPATGRIANRYPLLVLRAL